MAEQIEHGEAVGIAGDGFAIDDAGSRRQGCDRSHHQGETLGKVEALPGDKLHATVVEVGQDAEAVVLDFVNPAGPGRRLFGEARQARLVTPDLALQLTRYRHGR